MMENIMDKFLGKYCKIVTKEPSDKKAHVIIGTVKDIDHTDGFILIESNKGTWFLNTESIVAIKPKIKEY